MTGKMVGIRLRGALASTKHEDHDPARVQLPERPRRTLVICSWDGEEVGLTGSTEWGEQFADELRSKAVAYINVDEATSGLEFHGQAVASLAPAAANVRGDHLVDSHLSHPVAQSLGGLCDKVPTFLRAGHCAR